MVRVSGHDHQQRHGHLVDDQRLRVHLRRAARPRPTQLDDGRRPPPRTPSSATGSPTSGTRTPSRSSRRASRAPYTPRHPAPAARTRDDARASTGSACTRWATGRTGRDARRRRPGPHLPPAGPRAPGRARQPTAVVIPLRHQLVYTDDGSLDDLAGWTRTLTQGGRLRSLVDFGANSGDRTMSLVVDPALIDAVRRLADGNPPRSLAANLKAGQDDGEDEGRRKMQSTSATPTEDPSATPTEDAESDTPTARSTSTGELDPVVRAAAQAARTWLARVGEAMQPEDQVIVAAVRRRRRRRRRGSTTPTSTSARSRGAGTTLPGLDVTTTPVLSSPSGFLTAQGIRAAAPGVDDPAHRPDVRGPARPRTRPHRGP